MATLLDLLGDLNARINDTADQQVTKAEKTRYLNHGINATFPDLYKLLRDSTITLVDGTYEYNIPATFGVDARIFRVEVESLTAGRWMRVEEFEVFPGSPMVIAFETLPGLAGKKIRISAAVRLDILSADGDVYVGPAGTEELPVLYAMGCVTGRRIDDRLDHRRYSSVAGQNGVAVETMQGSAQFWFSQFDIALAKAAMPFPVA